MTTLQVILIVVAAVACGAAVKLISGKKNKDTNPRLEPPSEEPASLPGADSGSGSGSAPEAKGLLNSSPERSVYIMDEGVRREKKSWETTSREETEEGFTYNEEGLWICPNDETANSGDVCLICGKHGPKWKPVPIPDSKIESKEKIITGTAGESSEKEPASGSAEEVPDSSSKKKKLFTPPSKIGGAAAKKDLVKNKEEVDAGGDGKIEISSTHGLTHVHSLVKEKKPKTDLSLADVTAACSENPPSDSYWADPGNIAEQISHFQLESVPSEQLLALETSLCLYHPDYVASHFEEVYKNHFKFNIDPFYAATELLLAQRKNAEAKVLVEPMAEYLMGRKKKMLDGRFWPQDAFEAALTEAEDAAAASRRHTTGNYPGFLVAYGRVLQNTVTRKDGHDVCMLEESRPFLQAAVEMSPANSSAWKYLADAFEADEHRYMEYMRKALRFCYRDSGLYGMSDIYEDLAMHFVFKKQVTLATALCKACQTFGGTATGPRMLLSKMSGSTEGGSWESVLQHNGIQVGYSDLVRNTAAQLRSAEAYMKDDNLKSIVDAIYTRVS